MKEITNNYKFPSMFLPLDPDPGSGRKFGAHKAIEAVSTNLFLPI
jgi:hypothetical protein